MAVPAAVLSILVQANTGGATRGLMRFNQQLGATEAKSSRALGAVKTLAKGSAIATGIGLGYAVKKAADFEQQLDSLGSVSDASGKQMEQFRKQAMKAGADTKFSALDAAAAQTELAKGGLKVRQIMRGGLRSALALAAAGEMELAEAAETTANAIKLFGLRGKDSVKVADALATAANRTTADVSDFALALKMGGSVAKLAGMSFNETVVVLESLAEAGIKGSDAGTSLKSFFLAMTRDSPKAKKAMKELGVEIFDTQGNLKSLPAISANLRQAFGDLTREQFLNKAGTIAGSDAIRTLYSLYAAGPDKLGRLEEATAKSGTAAKVAADKQDNLKGKLENLQGSIETIAIGLGSKLLPGLSRFAEQVTKILNDPKLTGGEKFSRFMEMVTQAVEKAVPVVAAAGVKVAGALASGLARGWREMNPLMKLFTAAAVIRLVGGRGVLLKSGVAIGSTLGAGISAGAVGAAAGGAGAAAAGGGLIASMRAKVLPVAKRLGLAGVGIALADSVISEFGRRSALKSGDMWEELKGRQGPDPIGGDLLGKIDSVLPGVALKESEQAARRLIPALEGIQKAQRGIGSARAQALRQEIGKLSDATPELRRKLLNMVGAHEKVGERTKWLQDRFQSMRTKGARSFNELAQRVQFNTKLIRETMGTNSKRGQQAMTENFIAAARNVRQQMREAGKTTKRGTELIESYMVQALQSMGFSKADALALRKRGKGSKQTPMNGELRPNQRGGPIMEGALSGDSVPSILERGEYVLNRKAVRAVGKSKLDQINFKHAPRFQSGGMVRIPGDPDTTGGRDKVAASIAEAVGSWIKRYKIQVGYAFDPGGGHKSSGHNVTGTALDVVPGIGGSWDTLESGLKAAVAAGKTVYYGTNGIGTPLANHGRGNHGHVEWGGSGGVAGSAGAVVAKLIDRVVVDGPDSLLKSNVQGALDVTRAAANQLIKSRAATPPEGSFAGLDMAPGFTGGGTPAQNRQLGLQMAKARGWGGANWRALDYLWGIGESAWDHHADNPSSSAYGIPQAMSNIYPETATEEWRNSPAKQIQWGLDYIAGRYGNPAKALAFWKAQSPHWYQKGGAVGENMDKMSRWGQFGLPIATAAAGMQKGGAVGEDGGKGRWGKDIQAKEMPSFYKAVWKQAKKLGKFKGSAPDLVRGDLVSKGAWGEYNPGADAIHLAKPSLKALGDASNPDHGYAMQLLLHEMAHSQQKAGLSKFEREGGADLWAGWAGPQIFPKLGIGVSSTQPFGYPAWAEKLAAEVQPLWWQTRQFGTGKGGGRKAAGGPVRSYPLAQKGDVIGRPYQGTHSMGNWQSDNAIDIAAVMGTVVKAVTDGKVSKVAGGWGGGGGRTDGYQVTLDNPNSQWWYTHLKKAEASAGQSVGAGQRLGLSGAGNGVPHLHLGRSNSTPEQSLTWPIADPSRFSGSGDGGGGGGKGTSGEGGPIKKLAYVGDSIGEQVLKAGLKAKLGKIKLAASASAGKTSSWGVGVLKGLLDKDVGAAMFDMGTNDGTAGNLRPSIDAVEGMLKGRPLMMASLDPQSTDVAKKNAAIRSNANVVVPWAGIAQKYAADKVHPTSAGASKKASMIAAAAKKLRTGSKGESGLTDREKKQLKTPLKGSVGKVLTKTLKVLRSNKPAKFRGTRLKQLEKRIKGMDVGLPDGVKKQIANLRAGIEEVGGNADAASSFNVDNEDGTTSLGVIRGKTEAGWVTDQLDMLFRLRNKLIDAKKIVEKHRAEVQKLIERMQKRLQALAEDIRTAAKAKREAEQHLKQLQKHPKQNKVKIRNQKAAIERIEGNQSVRVRERDAISDKILPALTGKRKQFTAFINENIMGSDGLPQIQGLGSPLEKLTTLPPVGVLLGDIFDTQMRLRELAAPATAVTDSATPETSESADLLKQLLDEANLRTAVSQKQYEVLRNMPPYGGQFATGGVVPGPIGAARTIVAHGGETVTPSGNGSAPVVQLNFASGMEWLDKYIEVKVDGVTRKQARAGARGLPGRGGGI